MAEYIVTLQYDQPAAPHTSTLRVEAESADAAVEFAAAQNPGLQVIGVEPA